MQSHKGQRQSSPQGKMCKAQQFDSGLAKQTRNPESRLIPRGSQACHRENPDTLTPSQQDARSWTRPGSNPPPFLWLGAQRESIRPHKSGKERHEARQNGGRPTQKRAAARQLRWEWAAGPTRPPKASIQPLWRRSLGRPWKGFFGAIVP